MLALLRRRNVALLWLAGLVSMLGDWLLLIALPFFVYDLTGSALASGATFMASTLPRVFLSSVAGVFVDRWDRQRTLVLSDLLRGVLLLPLLLVRSTDTLWIVYIVAMLQASIAQFFVPAQRALLPHIVTERELLPANALLSLTENLTRLLGPVIGGVLYSTSGLASVVALDVGSFLLSGALLTLIVAGATVSTRAAGVAAGTTKLRDAWLVGLRLVGHNRLLTRIFTIAGLAMIGEGLFVALIVPFTRVVLGGDATQLGWLMSAQALGGIVGGIVLGRVGALLPPLRLIAIAGIIVGTLLLIIVNSGNLIVSLVLIALAGLPLVGFFVSLQTLLQQHTADGYRGRVFGAFGTVTALLTVVGMGLAGLLADRIGTVPTLSLAGVAYALAGAVALLTTPTPAAAPRPATEHINIPVTVQGDA